SYTISADFILPEGKFGEYFIGVRADYENRIYEYEEWNNQHLKKVNIALSPWPDLKPTFISHKDTLVSGQYTLVTWLVNNDGIAMAVDTPWVDKVYLSRDRVLDDGDIKIFQIENKNQIAS